MTNAITRKTKYNVEVTCITDNPSVNSKTEVVEAESLDAARGLAEHMFGAARIISVEADRHDQLMAHAAGADVAAMNDPAAILAARSERRAEKIAAEFVRILRSWATDEEWDAMLRDNAAEADSGVCHSHDFCDANMAMEEAFHNLGFKTCADIEEESAEKGVATDLWNAAWDAARAMSLGGGRPRPLPSVLAGVEARRAEVR